MPHPRSAPEMQTVPPPASLALVPLSCRVYIHYPSTRRGSDAFRLATAQDCPAAILPGHKQPRLSHAVHFVAEGGTSPEAPSPWCSVSVVLLVDLRKLAQIGR